MCVTVFYREGVIKRDRMFGWVCREKIDENGCACKKRAREIQ